MFALRFQGHDVTNASIAKLWATWQVKQIYYDNCGIETNCL
jgi:hypothetical protein